MTRPLQRRPATDDDEVDLDDPNDGRHGGRHRPLHPKGVCFVCDRYRNSNQPQANLHRPPHSPPHLSSDCTACAQWASALRIVVVYDDGRAPKPPAPRFRPTEQTSPPYSLGD